MQKSSPCFKNKKGNPAQQGETYPAAWTLQSLHPLPFPLSIIDTEMKYDTSSIRCFPVLTSVAVTQVS